MTGDQTDCYQRLRAALPAGWFPPPVLDAGGSPLLITVIDRLLWAMAWGLALVFGLLDDIRRQTRLATAADGWLDLWAGDFFGAGLPRNGNEGDAGYRSRIQVQLFRQRATRPALAKILEELTGNTPAIFEPGRPGDCGGYGLPVIGYGCAGHYGSQQLPYTAFVVVYRPASIGAANVPGYGAPQAGYGIGTRYIAAGTLLSLTDLNIFNAIEAVRPVGVQVWVQLRDG